MSITGTSFLSPRGPHLVSETTFGFPGPTSSRTRHFGPVITPQDLRVPICPTGWAPPAALPAPDAEDLLRVLLAIGRGRDDEQSVQQVNGDAVGALVAGSPNPEKEGEGGCQHGAPKTWLSTPPWSPPSYFLLPSFLPLPKPVPQFASEQGGGKRPGVWRGSFSRVSARLTCKREAKRCRSDQRDTLWA